MSFLRQHLRRATLSFSLPCTPYHSQKQSLRTISTTYVAHSASTELRARPRVVFSGIQPTGIPHVCSLFVGQFIAH